MPETKGSVTQPAEVARLRLVSQHIAGAGAADATAAVRWLTATQGQDLQGAITSIALRTTARSRPEVEAALDAGEIVRSWPMRGTLHLVAAEDLHWMLQLLGPRVIAGTAGRRAQLGLDEAQIEHAREVAVGALAGGGRLTRAALSARWEDQGLITSAQRGYHLIFNLALTGTLCLGPMDGAEQLLVLLDEWVERPRQLQRDEALGELAWRYFSSHGPATAQDFARWTNLVAADVRAGLALARPRLARLDVDRVEHLMHPAATELLRACRDQVSGVFLLPGFDEYVLGYRERGAVLAPGHFEQIVPGRNGVFRPTVVSDGQVVGTWKVRGTGLNRAVEATPFEAFSPAVADRIPGVFAALPA